MFNTSIHWEVNKWQNAVTEFMKVTSKTLPEVLNKEAGYIARHAYSMTPRANYERLKKQFFESAQIIKSTRSKLHIKYDDKYCPSKLGFHVTFTRRPDLLERWRKVFPKKGTPEKMQTLKEITGVLNRIFSACGYIRTGWKWAIEKFLRTRVKDAAKVYRTYGGYIEAKPYMENPYSVIINEARYASIVGEQALRNAFLIQAYYTINEIKRRLQNTANGFKPK